MRILKIFNFVIDVVIHKFLSTHNGTKEGESRCWVRNVVQVQVAFCQMSSEIFCNLNFCLLFIWTINKSRLSHIICIMLITSKKQKKRILIFATKKPVLYLYTHIDTLLLYIYFKLQRSSWRSKRRKATRSIISNQYFSELSSQV